MENIDHFDPYLVYKLDNRTIDSPSIVIAKITEYSNNKFFYLHENSSGAYVEIYKNIILENMNKCVKNFKDLEYYK